MLSNWRGNPGGCVVKRVIILSRPDDGHVERLTAELAELGASWIIIDPGAFPTTMQLTARLGGPRDQVDACQLALPDGQTCDLGEIGAVWYRRPSPIKADPAFPELQRTFIEREAYAGLWGILRGIEGLWVNHSGANSAAAYKPHQLALARKLWLHLPRSLLTHETAAFRQFYQDCQGQVIYKLLGFPAYEVEDGAMASTYTSRVPETLLEEAQRIGKTAHLFQAFEEKRCDLRVVIIGQAVFAVEIHPLSEETRLDFRLDYGALRYAVHDLPAEIASALVEMTRHYGLQYAAIDLLYTLKHRYVFLELNPCGQLGWLEEPTGLPLFATLAQLLAGIAPPAPAGKG